MPKLPSGVSIVTESALSLIFKMAHADNSSA